MLAVPPQTKTKGFTFNELIISLIELLGLQSISQTISIKEDGVLVLTKRPGRKQTNKHFHENFQVFIHKNRSQTIYIVPLLCRVKPRDTQENGWPMH